MSPANNAVLSLLAVHPGFIGGNEVYAQELSRQLDRHGWRSVLCFNSQPTPRVRHFLDLPNVSIDVVDTRSGELRAVQSLRRALEEWRPRILHFHYTNAIAPYHWLAKMHGVEKILITDHGSRSEGHEFLPAPL